MRKPVEIKLVNNVVHMTFNHIKKVNLQVAKEIINYREEITQSKPYPLFVVNNSLTQIDLSSFRYWGTKGMSNITATAVIINNPVVMFLFKVFGTFLNKKTIIKPFSNSDHALQWLDQFKTIKENV